MNVTNDITLRALNTSKLAPRANGGWDSALNAATAARGEVTSNAGPNVAMLTLEQLGRRSGGINTQMLANAGKSAPTAATEPESPEVAEIRAKTQTLVSQVFMGSMMKQMRDSPFKDTYFSGGKAGEAYAGMFDRQLAENAGHQVAKDLVDSIVKRWTKPKAINAGADNPLNAAKVNG